jgi:hypothetical protein
MVRTQIQLTEEQYRHLKKRAAAEGVSMAELIRNGVERFLSTPGGLTDDELRAGARELMGKFRSGKNDVAKRHDEYLAEDHR